MSTSETTASFGYWVRRRRLALDLTQAELAQQVACATITIAKIERDERRPSQQMAELLAARLGIAPGEHARFVAAALGERSVERLPIAQQPLDPALPPRSVLPQASTPFIGRRHELAEILLRLRDHECRLLTIVGPGGIGKTRLALEAAKRLLEHGSTGQDAMLFGDGVYFVPLQPVSTPDRFVPAVFDVLGLRSAEGEPPLQQIIHFLHDKRVLLVLDNFEHLVEGAGIVAELLTAAQGVKVLVTSRAALRLQEEWFYSLAGMQLPPRPASHLAGGVQGNGHSNSHSDAAHDADSDAIRMFIQAAQRAQAGFDPSREQEAIARICRLVDGVPLALELAAALTKVLPCAQIGDQIERGLDILVARQRNVADRHRSMRLILDQSWQQLSTGEQQALRRVAVFQGGFRYDAAAALEISLIMLAELVDKAWIYCDADGHYAVHELIKQYAAEKLAESPAEDAATRDQHMRFYLRQVKALEPALLGSGQRFALDQIAGEIDNIVSAWTRATSSDWPLVDDTLHALYLFFDLRGRYLEGKQLLAAALRLCEAAAGQDDAEQSALRLRLLARLGSLHYLLGQPEAARDYFELVLANGAEPWEQALVHCWLGAVLMRQGRRVPGEAELNACLRQARAIDDRDLMAEALLTLGNAAAFFAEYSEAERYGKDALALCRQTQRPDLTAEVLAQLGWCASSLGRYSESEQYYRESLAISEAIANPYGIAIATQFLGWVAYCGGNERLAEAVAMCEQALTIWRRIGHRGQTAQTLEDIAWLSAEQGDYAKAQSMAQEGVTIDDELGQADQLCYGLNALAMAACGLGKLEEARRCLQRALRLGYEVEMPDKVDLTLYSLAGLLVQESLLAAGALAQAGRLHALELLAFVVVHPATWQPIRDRAERLRDQLAVQLLAQLPPAAPAEALRRGRERSYDEMVAAALASLS